MRAAYRVSSAYSFRTVSGSFSEFIRVATKTQKERLTSSQILRSFQAHGDSSSVE
jgi:hypothetical protein